MDGVISLFLHKLPLLENIHQIKSAFSEIERLTKDETKIKDIGIRNSITWQLREIRELYEIDRTVSTVSVISQLRYIILSLDKTRKEKKERILEVERVRDRLRLSNFSKLTRAYTTLDKDLSDLILLISKS